MKRRLSPPVLICALSAIVFGGLMLGPFMHETDQAWLLDGGAAIAHGHVEIARAEFNFDKQFISYFLPAALFKFLPQRFQPDTLVLAGNVFGFIFFWAAFVWLLTRRPLHLPVALALPVILTPAFLVHSAFYGSAFVSAAFLLLLAGVLDREIIDWRRRAIIYGLAFCATGARADALLLLPLLAMLHSPQRTFASVVQSRNTWLMAAGGLTAFFFGRHFYTEMLVDYVAHHFHLNQFLGYLAFGLGAAGLLWLVILHALWRMRQAGRCGWWTFFLALGLMLPTVYYSLQLISTRHCTVPALAVLFFLAAKRGRAMLQLYFQGNIFSTLLKCALFLAAIIPVFAGVNLADVRHPVVSFNHVTLLPTVAGASPAGGYLHHAWNVRRRQGFLDHNQAIWNAAKNTRYEARNGVVSIAATPVESYLIFAVRLQGLAPRHFVVETELPEKFYMESRSLMRFQYIWPDNILPSEKFFSSVSLLPVTDANWHGITILRGETNHPFASDLAGELWAFNVIFAGDEFRLEPVANLQKIPADWAGKKMVLASRRNFSVSGHPEIQTKEISSRTLGRWHVLEMDSARAGEKITVEGVSPEELFVAVGAFPVWMSVRKL